MIGIESVVSKIRLARRRMRLKNDFIKFNTLSKPGEERFGLRWAESRAVYEDSKETGFDTHYIYHLAWAARVLAQTNPESHVDISSKLEFPTIVSAFIPVKFYDYRPAHISLSNMTSEHADLTGLSFKKDSVASLSCMHVIEHIGLGRYGDPIDPDGDLKAMRELQRVLAKNGDLLFVVPVGKPRIVFNMHRIYSYEQVIEAFKGLTLKEFMLIPDNAREVGTIRGASEETVANQNYGCGCFWFKKP
jgi:hypothetical protein